MLSSYIFYAFKEAVTGFERLYAFFGPFELTPDNIKITPTGEVKVWISSSIHHNTKASFKGEDHPEAQIVQQLVEAFKLFAVDTTLYREFFSSIQTCKSFLDLLKALESFKTRKKTT